MPKNGKKPDSWLIISTTALVFIGLLAVYSAGLGRAYVGYVPSPLSDLSNQLISLALGVGLAFLVYRVNAKVYRSFAYPVFIFSLFLLLLVYIPGFGVAKNFSTRWIEIAGFSFQPSEFAKVGVILLTGAFLSSRDPKKMPIGEILRLIIMFGIVAFLILKEPDLGSTVIIFLIFVCQYFLSGAPMMGLVVLFAVFVLGVIFEGLTNVGYWKQRVTAYLEPLRYTDSISYHMVQSLIALSNGGFFGMGLFHGQQKFGRLPMVESDSIFGLITEELGFVGAVLVIVLFAVFVLRALKIAAKCQDRFTYLVALGIALHVGLQAFVNMGVSTCLLPFTGITLPFVSKGGTSLIVNLVEVGILLGIEKSTKEVAV